MSLAEGLSTPAALTEFIRSPMAHTHRFLAWRLAPLLSLALVVAAPAIAQEQPPELRVGTLPDELRLDGVLDEPAWQAADAISGLTTTVPVEGGTPSGRTVVRVLGNSNELVIGIRCDDPDAAAIVAYSSARDSSLGGEDHVKIVFDTFLDGRSGYVFAVNPRGARYDALEKTLHIDSQVGSTFHAFLATATAKKRGRMRAVPRLPCVAGRET